MLPALTNELLRGGDGGNTEGDADTSETGGGVAPWVLALVAVVCALLVGGAIAGCTLWKRRRSSAKAFQRLGGDEDSTPRRSASVAATSHPLSFVDSPSARSPTAQALRLLPSLPYSGVTEPASPGYSPTVPRGHSGALPLSPTSTASLPPPASPSPAVQHPPTYRQDSRISLEPQALLPTLVPDDALANAPGAAQQVPSRPPSLPPPPYSPRAVGVGVPLSPGPATRAV